MTKNSKDYYANKAASQTLVDKIMNYHHKQGYDWVKVWLEPDLTESGRRFWNIRSNIKYLTPSN